MVEKKTRGEAKLTKDMREILHLAFTRAGGIDYLVRQADAEPKAFMALIGRLVPQQATLDIVHTFNLGAAMLEQQKTLERLNNVEMQPVTIEHDTFDDNTLNVKDKR